MIQNQPNQNAISELQAEVAYWKKQYEEKTFDFSGANATVNDLPYNIYAWDANGQLIGRSLPSLGSVITWDNKSWQIQHYDGNGYVYLAATTCPSSTTFGSNTTYSGSTLASVASTYQSNNMSSSALAQCQSVTVNGVTSKVFVPSYVQLSSEWDWPKAAAANRICTGGADNWYWVSSPYDSSYVWNVRNKGDFGYNGPIYMYGFRPAVKIPITAL